MRRERWRLIATAAFVAILLSPAIRPGDGVPLSSYPMYASPRSGEVEFVVAHGLTASGEAVPLRITVVAGTSDPLIAETWLRGEVIAGRSVALCQTVAERIEAPEIIEVEVRSERHDVVAQVQGRSSLLEAETVARCPVGVEPT